jgi:eukaryotic-like serine/threonine-protein kinase
LKSCWCYLTPVARSFCTLHLEAQERTDCSSHYRTAEEVPPMIGQMISHYRVIEQVGQGGMGVVYKAEDTRLHRTVALKFLNPEMLLDQREKLRFEHEAEAAAQLGHPNIATIYDFDEHIDPGTATRYSFIAMEFVDGESLKRKIARGPIPLDEVASIARQLTGALHAAHQKGIVHRDVKPANIFVREDGSVKVLDFGVAKLAGETRVTAQGQVVGSVAYMSPEQLRGEDVDARSDIWSFGVVLYEMLVQRFPFRGDHAAAIVYSITNEDPSGPETLRGGIPEELSSVCMACLRKDPAERPSSMAVVQSMLGGEMVPRPAKKRAVRRVRSFWRLAAWVSSGAAVVALLILLVPGIRTPIEQLLPGSGETHRILVVLPFTPIDSSGNCVGDCAGLSSMVPSRLAELTRSSGSLFLVGPRDLRSYGVTNSEEARKVLGASLVVTGSMKMLRDIVQLTVDLFDPNGRRLLDSRVDSYPADNYRSMEDGVVRHVLEMLKLEVRQPSDTRVDRGTADDEAYQLYAQGRGYLLEYQKSKNVRIAVELFKKALARDSVFAEARAGLSEACWQMFEATEDTAWVAPAVTEARRAVELKPTLPQAFVAVGMVNNGTGHYEQAVADFEKALDLDPRNPEAYRNLANAYNKLGQFAMAESTYRRAIGLNSSYWAGYNQLGSFLYVRGRYEEAAAQFRKVTVLTPDNIRGHNNLAVMYLHLQKPVEASVALQHVVEIEPTSAGYSNLGAALFYCRNYEGANEAYRRALQKDSANYRLWGNLAGSQFYTPGERERSITTYRQAIRLAEQRRAVDPRDRTVLSHLADFYSAIGAREKAISFVTQALEGSKNDPAILERAAWTYLAVGDTTKARRYIRSAVDAGFPAHLIALNPVVQEMLTDEEIRTLLQGSGVAPH